MAQRKTSREKSPQDSFWADRADQESWPARIHYAFLNGRKKITQKNMHFQYAFLMAPRFSKNMHFSMGKCLCVYFLGWLQKTLTSSIVQINISLNYAFLMVPRLSRNMHFSSGKCIFLLFG